MAKRVVFYRILPILIFSLATTLVKAASHGQNPLKSGGKSHKQEEAYDQTENQLENVGQILELMRAFRYKDDNPAKANLSFSDFMKETSVKTDSSSLSFLESTFDGDIASNYDLEWQVSGEEPNVITKFTYSPYVNQGYALDCANTLQYALNIYDYLNKIQRPLSKNRKLNLSKAIVRCLSQGDENDDGDRLWAMAKYAGFLDDQSAFFVKALQENSRLRDSLAQDAPLEFLDDPRFSESFMGSIRVRSLSPHNGIMPGVMSILRNDKKDPQKLKRDLENTLVGIVERAGYDSYPELEKVVDTFQAFLSTLDRESQRDPELASLIAESDIKNSVKSKLEEFVAYQSGKLPQEKLLQIASSRGDFEKLKDYSRSLPVAKRAELFKSTLQNARSMETLYRIDASNLNSNTDFNLGYHEGRDGIPLLLKLAADKTITREGLVYGISRALGMSGDVKDSTEVFSKYFSQNKIPSNLHIDVTAGAIENSFLEPDDKKLLLEKSFGKQIRSKDPSIYGPILRAGYNTDWIYESFQPTTPKRKADKEAALLALGLKETNFSQDLVDWITRYKLKEAFLSKAPELLASTKYNKHFIQSAVDSLRSKKE